MFGSYYSCPTNAAYTAIPACYIYYNNNTTYDRHIAVYGEVNYAFTDTLRLTLGERVGRDKFCLNHYADGLENFGPSPARASEKRDAQHAQGDAWPSRSTMPTCST